MLATHILNNKPPNVFTTKKFSQSPHSIRARAKEAFKDLSTNQKKSLLSALVLAAHGFDESKHDLGLFLVKAVHQLGKEFNPAA